ncbi:MAG: spore maturation protein [Rhodospirillales bacterium]|nr:spore maturation protein [Rhodospirillales bacterium]
MNVIFFALVVISFTVAGYRHIVWQAMNLDDVSPMESLGTAMIEAAGNSVTLAIGLIGVMALFIGLMKVAEAGGLLVIIAKVVRPLMQRLFPDVPVDHPAMGAMILNISANALGLANAATPFGIRAMQELDTLNRDKGTATNAMALFLAINTSSVTLLPTGVIALRAAAGSDDPAAIVPTTLFATICSTTMAIIMAKLLQRWWFQPDPGKSTITPTPAPSASAEATDTAPEASGEIDVTLASKGYPLWVSFAVLAGVFALVPLMVVYGRDIAPWIIPGLMTGLLTFGAARRVHVYETLVEGAREGFQVAVRIIPYLVAILVAVAMFRASGALAVLVTPLGHLTSAIGLPADALPMALLRPLSGSGAYGVLASIINNPAIGPDSYTGILVSTFQGSTETTFYVLAVYFGAVGVRRVRHTLVAALAADATGIAAAVFICSMLFG